MVRVKIMVLHVTFNNISVLLVKETGMSGENHQPATNFII